MSDYIKIELTKDVDSDILNIMEESLLLRELPDNKDELKLAEYRRDNNIIRFMIATENRKLFMEYMSENFRLLTGTKIFIEPAMFSGDVAYKYESDGKEFQFIEELNYNRNL